MSDPRTSLRAAGFNLIGELAARDYDACVPDPWRTERIDPEVRGVRVVGHGGRDLWSAFRRSPEAGLRADPLDAYTRRIFDATPALCSALYTDQREGHYLPLIALAQRAGLGNPGRLGLLLHPEYGPWMGIRGVLFTREVLGSGKPSEFSPCDECPAPCAAACHAGVVGESGIEHLGCMRARLERPACRVGCDARRACIVGPEHAYGVEQTAHHHALRLPSPWG